MGMLCQKAGFGYTVFDDATGGVREDRLDVPADKKDRGEQLAWLLSEAKGMFTREAPISLWVQKSGTGQHSADPQRHEVEACVQIAAHCAGVPCRLQVTESVRSALGVPRGPGAYKQLLKRPDIAARSNNLKREQYAYALAAVS
jgi:hypothetical protein